MKMLSCLLPASLLLCSLTVAQGQRRTVEPAGREIAQRQELRRLLAKAGVDVPAIEITTSRPRAYRELKIRWTDPTKSANQLRPAPSSEEEIRNAKNQVQPPDVSILEEKKRTGDLPRQRSLQLSQTQVFIAAVDAGNRLRWWSIMPDPRLVRAETPTPAGELRRHDYYRTDVTLLVPLPDDPEIVSLRVFHPVWNGTFFDLEPLIVVPTR